MDCESPCRESLPEKAARPLESRLHPDRPKLPEHLIGLPGDGWAVWRWVGLRSTGFPAAEVLRLAFPCCAAGADELLALEDALEADRAEILSQLADASEIAAAPLDPLAPRVLASARRQLESGRLPGATQIPEIDAALCRLSRASAAAAAASQRLDRLLAAARQEASRAIRAIAASPRFREAVAWQNHAVLQTCIAPLLRNVAGRRASKHRQHEELVASYFHRYCVKNETIGFFGPVGWAKIVDAGPLEVDPGPDLLRSRQVYFEQWAIDRLADRLSSIDALKPWMAVRPTPAARIEGLTVRPSFRKPTVLTPQEMAVFVACDGVRRSCDLADRFCREGAAPFLARERLDAILDKLERERLIARRWELPIDAHPEHRLRELLERVGDERLRQCAIAPLAQLEADREAVGAAVGDPDTLHRALLDLDAHFTAATGVRPRRAAGEMYWGRTLAYEDCQRDVAVRMGPAMLAALGPPLTLVLASARWLTYRVGQHCQTVLARLFERLSRASGSSAVGFVEFYNYGLYLLSKETAFAGIAAELQQRWAEVLVPPAVAQSVRYASARLQARAAKAFDAPSPGWIGACYHSPDLLIAASSLDAINAGDCDFVLGELHVGVNTLRGQFLVEQHPDAGELLRGIEADLPELRLTPITPRRYAQRATRIFPVLASRGQSFVATTLDSIPPAGAASLTGGSLVVRRSDGDLVVESRDGGLRFDLLQSFAGVLARIVVDGFAIMQPVRHTPRVSFDDLIVAREAWRFARSEIDFAAKSAGTERFLAARRWRALHGMPRWVFVKIAAEPKPFYLDFDSPIAVDIVARQIRNSGPSAAATGSVTVSEMIPGHGQHWLPDSDGKRYSCELRLVAVDRQASANAAPRRAAMS